MELLVKLTYYEQRSSSHATALSRTRRLVPSNDYTAFRHPLMAPLARRRLVFDVSQFHIRYGNSTSVVLTTTCGLSMSASLCSYGWVGSSRNCGSALQFWNCVLETRVPRLVDWHVPGVVLLVARYLTSFSILKAQRCVQAPLFHVKIRILIQPLW